LVATIFKEKRRGANVFALPDPDNMGEMVLGRCIAESKRHPELWKAETLQDASTTNTKETEETTCAVLFIKISKQ
jgi:hypothetical protein